MLRNRPVLSMLLIAFAIMLFAPSAWARCEICKGSPGNRSCRSVAADESGYSNCSNDFFGNCINGTTSCTGTACGKDICEEHQGSRREPAAPGGEVLPEPMSACELPGLIIEA